MRVLMPKTTDMHGNGANGDYGQGRAMEWAREGRKEGEY